MIRHASIFVGVALITSAVLHEAHGQQPQSSEIAPNTCWLLNDKHQLVAAWPARGDGTCWAHDGPPQPPPTMQPLIKQTLPNPDRKSEKGW